jgi:hypothetical protein
MIGLENKKLLLIKHEENGEDLNFPLVAKGLIHITATVNHVIVTIYLH